MSLSVPARRALAAALSGGLVAGLLAVVGGPGPASAQQLPFPPAGSASPSASPTASPSVSASPSPTASPTATVSPSASASPTATTCAVPVPSPLPCPVPAASSSPSATPTASTSPTPAGPVQPVLDVSPSTIDAGGTARVAGAAEPGSTVELQAYSRPSTTYRVVRRDTVGPDGRFAFTVRPTGNTRLFARSTTEAGSSDSRSVVLTVRSTLSLAVERTGTRAYRFAGSVRPARAGQVVRITYRRGSGQVEAVRTKVGADGRYAVPRTFSGTGTFEFTARTGTDITNAGGVSPVRRTTIR